MKDLEKFLIDSDVNLEFQNMINSIELVTGLVYEGRSFNSITKRLTVYLSGIATVGGGIALGFRWNDAIADLCLIFSFSNREILIPLGIFGYIGGISVVCVVGFSLTAFLLSISEKYDRKIKNDPDDIEPILRDLKEEIENNRGKILAHLHQCQNERLVGENIANMLKRDFDYGFVKSFIIKLIATHHLRKITSTVKTKEEQQLANLKLIDETLGTTIRKYNNYSQFVEMLMLQKIDCTLITRDNGARDKSLQLNYEMVIEEILSYVEYFKDKCIQCNNLDYVSTYYKFLELDNSTLHEYIERCPDLKRDVLNFFFYENYCRAHYQDGYCYGYDMYSSYDSEGLSQQVKTKSLIR